MAVDRECIADPNGADAAPPVRNLRITFWGVQGSCPIFPTSAEMEDYARRVARFAIGRTLANIQERLARGELSPDALGSLTDPTAMAAYQRGIGLPDLPVYGGETTCLQVETGDGETILFDLGTGVRDFSHRAVPRWPASRPRVLHVLASHEHLDHRAGLAFATFCFERTPPFTINVYGTRQYLTALDQHYGIFSRRVMPAMHVDDPLDYRIMAAQFTATELRDPTDEGLPSATPPWTAHDLRQPIRIGDGTVVRAFDVYHGITRCLAYRVEHGGRSFVFCTDHELRHGHDPADPRQVRSEQAERRLIDACRDTDAAYFDGQYQRAEYDGTRGIGSAPAVGRIDWGHSCIEDVVARARQANVGRTFIGHHDPDRRWAERIRLDSELKTMTEGRIELAKVRTVIDL